jgi:alkylation response protein AidB-like acyl-CoA dehydrogenase
MSEISLEEFRTEALSFLEANAQRKEVRSEFKWGEGSDDVAIFEEKSEESELAAIAEAKKWRAARFDNGFGWIGGPEEFGGRGLPAAYERVYGGLEAKFETPAMGIFTISLGMVAPTILAHAIPEVQDMYLSDLYRGDQVACQLFSEPGAGSDLASLQTKAELDGEEWIVTGQKVWTSSAQHADIGEVICRTDPNLPKHKGLTGFVVDMKAPGVEIRPLRQMTGGANFNEVFFDEVRIPDSHRLGDVNHGWSVALTTLMNERASIGGGSGGGQGLLSPERLHAMLIEFDLEDDKVIRDEIAQTYIHFQVAKLNNQRALDKIKSGGLPGPELSTAKLALTHNMKRMSEVIAQILGPRITADTGEWGTYAWNQLLLGVPGMRVAGGTDEVMRNIVAERVLGLPKDPGIDSKTPFNELLVGTQRS